MSAPPLTLPSEGNWPVAPPPSFADWTPPDHPSTKATSESPSLPVSLEDSADDSDQQS